MDIHETIGRKAFHNMWAYLFSPEDTTSSGGRHRAGAHSPGSAIDRFKSILWLALPILLGLAIGRICI